MTTFEAANGGGRVSGRLYRAAPAARMGVTFVLAHGAGAPQTSPFIVTFAEAFAARGLDVATFDFPYMQSRRRVPDSGAVLEACYASVVRHLGRMRGLTRNTIVAAGKSMGGRIASQLVAHRPDEAGAIRGLVFLGYPLHPPGRTGQLRTRHLPAIDRPMLFVQGERDALGTPGELVPILDGLDADADLFVIDGGDHSFKVPRKLGVSQTEVYERIQDAVPRWIADRVLGAG
jgi:predicted alpha/beta-hydrolase family hydrolase